MRRRPAPATTGSRPSWPPGASPSPGETRPTRWAPRRSAWARQHQGRPPPPTCATTGPRRSRARRRWCAARAAGVRTAVVSASRNMVAVLASAGLRAVRRRGRRGRGCPPGPARQAWTRRCSWRRRGGSGWSRPGPRWSRRSLAGVRRPPRRVRAGHRGQPWRPGRRPGRARRRGGRGRPRRARRGGGGNHRPDGR